jgi:hypothetical protein
MEVSGQPHNPADLPLGKDPLVLIEQEIGRPWRLFFPKHHTTGKSFKNDYDGSLLKTFSCSGVCREKKPPWPESASKLYRPSDRRLSAKLVPTFVDRGCHVVSVTDPYSHILSFLEQGCYFFYFK